MERSRTKTMKVDNVCVVLLKWDAFEFGRLHGIDVLQVMSDWLSSRELFILAQEDIDKLSGKQIDEIYFDKHDKPYYEALRESLVGTAAIALLVGGAGDVPGRMKGVKGDPDTMGSIRWEWSFKRAFEKSDEYNDWQERSGKYVDAILWQQIHHKIYQDDRLHSTVNAGETVAACNVLFRHAIIEDALSRYPQIAKIVRPH
jgi:hypothetical protein